MGKVCSKCKVEKELTDFYRDKNRKSGVYPSCKECCKKYEQSEKGKESRRRKNKEFRQSEKGKKYMKEYFKIYEQSEKRKESKRRYNKKYNQTERGKESKKRGNEKYNESYPHLRQWRSLLHNSLKRLNTTKSKSTIEMLGYSADELKTYLDNLNMKWGVDHIDHKIPVTHFKEDTPPHIVNHLLNLQPLDPHTNRSKGNSYADRVDEEYYRMARPYLL